MNTKPLLSTLLLLSVVGTAAVAEENTRPTKEMNTNTHPASLGYAILYVKDVPASLAFYEKAFGLKRRFFTDEGGKPYGELETGAARLAFACPELAKAVLKRDVVIADPKGAPLGFEVAIVTGDVEGLYRQACASGAEAVAGPEIKPWGQTVAYVRDNSGYLVSLCTPLP